MAHQTHDRITNLLPPGSVTPLTRLLLANALYVRAPWHEPFQPQDRTPFQTPGGPVPVPMMGVSLRQAGLVGSGWQAARIPLASRELALTVILPRGDLAAMRRELSGTGLVELLRTDPMRGVDLSLPPLRLRSVLPLRQVLADLGMPRAFSPSSELDGLTTSEQLQIGVVEHQGWIAIDKDGLEAAAATAVTVVPVSAPAQPSLKLVFDRPFLACVHDVATALPLLVLQVSDPSLAGS